MSSVGNKDGSTAVKSISSSSSSLHRIGSRTMYIFLSVTILWISYGVYVHLFPNGQYLPSSDRVDKVPVPTSDQSANVVDLSEDAIMNRFDECSGPNGKNRRLFLYCVPVNTSLAEDIHAFFKESRSTIGKNRAHIFPPHFTLSHNFYDCEENFENYVEVVSAVLELQQKSPRTRLTSKMISMKSVVYNPQIIGIIIESPRLTQFLNRLVDVLRPHKILNVNTVSNSVGFHLTLSHRFQSSERSALEELAKKSVDISKSVEWEIVLFESIPDEEKWVDLYRWPLP